MMIVQLFFIFPGWIDWPLCVYLCVRSQKLKTFSASEHKPMHSRNNHNKTHLYLRSPAISPIKAYEISLIVIIFKK